MVKYSLNHLIDNSFLENTNDPKLILHMMILIHLLQTWINQSYPEK